MFLVKTQCRVRDLKVGGLFRETPPPPRRFSWHPVSQCAHLDGKRKLVRLCQCKLGTGLFTLGETTVSRFSRAESGSGLSTQAEIGCSAPSQVRRLGENKK